MYDTVFNSSNKHIMNNTVYCIRIRKVLYWTVVEFETYCTVVYHTYSTGQDGVVKAWQVWKLWSTVYDTVHVYNL